jgi:IMP dehydrogenase
MNIIEGLTFDDVFLIPKYSNIEHRAEVSTKTQILPSFTLDVPFVSANMDTVTEHKMAFSMMEHGGVGVLHRYLSIESMLEQIELYNAELVTHKVSPKAPFIVSIGANDFERVKAAYTVGIRNFCIDVAHGHHLLVERCIQKLKELDSDIGIIAGNVCTYQGAYDLFKWGADCVKVGVGPGSICTTRVVAGVGVPQLSAIHDVYNYAKTRNVSIIGDGGIKLSGDIVKAVAAGANLVMLGSLFAGTDEAPGEEIIFLGTSSNSRIDTINQTRFNNNNSKMVWKSQNVAGLIGTNQAKDLIG